jgi:predicted nucleic acid-binding protein
MHDIASDLFRAAARGDLQVTTTEVVLHEVLFVLTSKKHYSLPIAEAVELLLPLITLEDFKFEQGEKMIYLRAFDILAESPGLEFADAVIAARAQRQGIPLATFDEPLGRLPFVIRWHPGLERTPGER